MFPGAKKAGLQPTSPILITANSTIAVPSNAVRMHAYIIAGGGSGASSSDIAGNACISGGGGCGGAAYIVAQINLIKGNAVQSNFRLQSVSFTIGSGGAGFTSGAQAGNPGGNTTLAYDGTGITATVTGGTGGVAYAASGYGTAGTLSGSYVRSVIVPGVTGIYALPLPPYGETSTSPDAVSGDTANCRGGSGDNIPSRAGVGMSTSGVLLPWWMQQAGITSLGAGGTGSSSSPKGAGGGGGGFNGNGGGGTASNAGSGLTAGAGSGYGSGSGGAASAGSNTILAGAPGCAVCYFEVVI